MFDHFDDPHPPEPGPALAQRLMAEGRRRRRVRVRAALGGALALVVLAGSAVVARPWAEDDQGLITADPSSSTTSTTSSTTTSTTTSTTVVTTTATSEVESPRGVVATYSTLNGIDLEAIRTPAQLDELVAALTEALGPPDRRRGQGLGGYGCPNTAAWGGFTLTLGLIGVGWDFAPDVYDETGTNRLPGPARDPGLRVHGVSPYADIATLERAGWVVVPAAYGGPDHAKAGDGTFATLRDGRLSQIIGINPICDSI